MAKPTLHFNMWNVHDMFLVSLTINYMYISYYHEILSNACMYVYAGLKKCPLQHVCNLGCLQIKTGLAKTIIFL